MAPQGPLSQIKRSYGADRISGISGHCLLLSCSFAQALSIQSRRSSSQTRKHPKLEETSSRHRKSKQLNRPSYIRSSWDPIRAVIPAWLFPAE